MAVYGLSLGSAERFVSLVRDPDGSLARSPTPWIAPGCGSTLFHVIVDGGLYRVGVKRTSVF